MIKKTLFFSLIALVALTLNSKQLRFSEPPLITIDAGVVGGRAEALGLSKEKNAIAIFTTGSQLFIDEIYSTALTAASKGAPVAAVFHHPSVLEDDYAVFANGELFTLRIDYPRANKQLELGSVLDEATRIIVGNKL